MFEEAKIKNLIKLHEDKGTEYDNYTRPQNYIDLMEEHLDLIHELRPEHLVDENEKTLISRIIHKYATCYKNINQPSSEIFQVVEKLYLKAIAFDPGNFHANLAIGTLYFRHLEDDEKAKHFVSRAKELKDHQPSSQHLGILFEIFPY